MEAREAHNLEVNGSNPFSVNGGEAKKIARWRRGLACRAHNPKVGGSNPLFANGGAGQNLWGGQNKSTNSNTKSFHSFTARSVDRDHPGLQIFYMAP